jgi:SAM-dependent methyltransferase
MVTLDKNAIKYFCKNDAQKRFGRDRGFFPLEVSEPARTRKMLEVGCGSTFSIKPTGLAVGVDISPPLLKAGRLLQPEGEFIRADARYLPLRKGIFDLVISRDLLHHIVGLTPQLSKDNIRRAIGELERVRSTMGNMLLAEHCVFLRLGALLAYTLCKLSMKFNVELSFFDIRSGLIVYFLTLKQLTDLLTIYGLESFIVRRDHWRIMRVPIGEFVIIVAK